MNLADTKSSSDSGQSFEHPAGDGMLYVPGGTFRMGSDRHYPEEAPVHRVTVEPRIGHHAVDEVVGTIIWTCG